MVIMENIKGNIRAPSRYIKEEENVHLNLVFILNNKK